MYRQVAAIAEYYCVGVLAVAVIANRTFRILFFTSGLAVDCGCTTRPWSMRLRWLRIWFGDAFRMSAFALDSGLSQVGLTLLQSMPLLLDLCDGHFEDRRLDAFYALFFALDIERFQPPIVLLVHVVFYTAYGNCAGSSLSLSLKGQIQILFDGAFGKPYQAVFRGPCKDLALLVSDVRHCLVDIVDFDALALLVFFERIDLAY
jgi:hypothetical protein